MKTKILLIQLFLLLGTFQVMSQIQPQEPFKCASFVDIEQSCNGTGTVDLSFHIRNNSGCTIAGIKIDPVNVIGIGSPTPFSINPFSQSSSTYTIDGAIPGSRSCFRINLFSSEGQLCCTSVVCVDVIDSACCNSNLDAKISKIGCAPEGWVAIQVTGGSGGYSSPDATYEGDGLFEELDLDPGTYTWTFEDSNGCQVELTFTIPTSECCDFEANAITGGCAPNGWVAIQVEGGSGDYSSADATYEGDGLFEELDLDEGSYTWTFEDSNGCQTDVTFEISAECCDFSAEKVNSGCAPEGWVAIQVRGGSGVYSSPDATYEGDGLFEEKDLDPGTYTWTFEDSNGCQANVTFTIRTAECCDIQAKAITGGCSPDGWVAIQVTGGSGVYSSPDANYEGGGLFEELDLDAGTYTYTFWDDLYGCEIDVTFAISEDCCDFCNEFESVLLGNYQVPPGTAMHETLVSSVSATIVAEFFAGCVPDGALISINGVVVVDQIAGTGTGPDCYPGISGFETEIIEFCVEPCDVVSFDFVTQACDLDDDECTGLSSGWNFRVTDCIPKDSDGGGLGIDQGVVSRSRKIVKNHSTHKLELLPTIVSEFLSLNILKNNNDFEDRAVNPNQGFQINEDLELQILNNAGITLISTNITRQDKMEVDVSTLPSGIYFVKITSDNGESIVERFVKN